MAISLPRKPNLFLARTTMLRPSAVSSAIDESCAASARSRSVVSPTGINSLACLLPSVIVPVLSNKRMSTSPAASIARPLVASTFALFSRAIPAIPIEESNAPIVVGARHTSKATMFVRLTGDPCPA